ncbi:hypothetical protein BC940DRAFT_297279 [Gongronella butleri]|nr:hypothetical protein BC940DRAFT_297279 [Gongronella butleri]
MDAMTTKANALSIPINHQTDDTTPTPSSSYCQSLSSKESKVSTVFSRSDRLLASKAQQSRQYGSFMTMPISDDTISFQEAPPTPPTTTISPNDDDEGLYLLWTHQILRDHGLRPSSCRTSSFERLADDDDDDDDDSSQSSFTSTPPTTSLFASLCACFVANAK